MTDFDLVIRNGTIATAADVFAAEIGIRDERIVALGTGLGAGREEIDAPGCSYCPAGSMRIVTSISPRRTGRSARTISTAARFRRPAAGPPRSFLSPHR